VRFDSMKCSVEHIMHACVGLRRFGAVPAYSSACPQQPDRFIALEEIEQVPHQSASIRRKHA
jgi:hypothetical protein